MKLQTPIGKLEVSDSLANEYKNKTDIELLEDLIKQNNSETGIIDPVLVQILTNKKLLTNGMKFEDVKQKIVELKNNSITVAIKEPGQPMREALIKNELSEFQKLVGGYIETILPLKNKNIVAVLNDSGKILGLLPNFKLRNDIIVGTVVFSKSNNDGEFVSLNKNDIWQIKELFKDVENCSKIVELLGIIDSLINQKLILELEVKDLKEQLNQEAQKYV